MGKRPNADIAYDEDSIGLFTKLSTIWTFAFCLILWAPRELFFQALWYLGIKKEHPRGPTKAKGYAPIVTGKDDLFHRGMFYRLKDYFHNQLTGQPGAWITLRERRPVGAFNFKEQDVEGVWTVKETNNFHHVINLASYNYMGFANNEQFCEKNVISSLKHFGVSPCSVSNEMGTTSLHATFEKRVATYVGQESAIVFGMGFASNSCTIPAIVHKGDLIISDDKNHASIAAGCKSSGAKVKPFKHQDFADAERIIRNCIRDGQSPNADEYVPWGKIMIIVEGIYSMEGDILFLPEVIALKKKYNCYLYVDEAHSIGGLGEHGRGVCDYYGVDPREVDILMGTFSKSFGGAGGYISGKTEIMDYIRQKHWSAIYANHISVPLATQVLSAMDVITGNDGTDIGAKKLRQLKANIRFLRKSVEQMGFVSLGCDDSPVVPLMAPQLDRLGLLIKLGRKKHVGIIGVGPPATGVFSGRMRLCVSAGHSKDDILLVAKFLDECGELCQLKFKKKDAEQRYGKKPYLKLYKEYDSTVENN